MMSSRFTPLLTGAVALAALSGGFPAFAQGGGGAAAMAKLMAPSGVNGGAKPGQCGGVKPGHWGPGQGCAFSFWGLCGEDLAGVGVDLVGVGGLIGLCR
jgi:hypothetical protein